MDETMQSNGAQNGKVYVKFGPRSTQEIRIEWAERMLAGLHEKHPNVFGKLLTEAATDAK
jgi:hypothetical protein